MTIDKLKTISIHIVLGLVLLFLAIGGWLSGAFSCSDNTVGLRGDVQSISISDNKEYIYFEVETDFSDTLSLKVKTDTKCKGYSSKEKISVMDIEVGDKIETDLKNKGGTHEVIPKGQ